MVEKAKGGVSGIGLCPFSWIEVTKPAGCLSSLFGGQTKIVSEPQPCMMSRCQLWDSAQGNCGLITKKQTIQIIGKVRSLEGVQEMLSSVLIYGVKTYQKHFSKYFAGSCLYTPSCSEYSLEAIRLYGAKRGSVLAIKRLLRCRRPYNGGYDPVKQEMAANF